jgi:hypothetical protein
MPSASEKNHRHNHRAVSDEKNEEPDGREIGNNVWREQRLKRSTEAPEVGELVRPLPTEAQRQNDCDSRPVAEVHRQPSAHVKTVGGEPRSVGYRSIDHQQRRKRERNRACNCGIPREPHSEHYDRADDGD